MRQSNVVSVLEVEEHEDRVGLCMEFVQGQTLEDVLQLQGTFSARETVLVGEDVCRALAAVHNAGFVHRDVKARNVMREQAGRIVLMDFGTGREARALEDASRPDVAGTPLYMAPEMLAGEPASMRSDVYSVGVLLYHLVTSQYPIVAQSIDDLRAAHKTHRRRYLSEIRPDLPMPFVRVVERALSEHPQDRYPNAGALLGALGTALGDLHDSRWEAARPVLAVAAAISLAVVLPVVLGFLTTMGFNAILQRTEFANETLSDWWVWGARAADRAGDVAADRRLRARAVRGHTQPAARRVGARQAVRRLRAAARGGAGRTGCRWTTSRCCRPGCSCCRRPRSW